ncbi:MAG TPA: hypothetical protein VKK79_00695 [Candidatus Lokiarchaeia archaeon]|nr:hypothetical protein [Candidatus Lokiarchaeia archaeon]
MAEVIQKIGELSKDQAEVLKVILMRGPASLSTLTSYTKKKAANLQNVVQELESLQLIRQIPGVVTRYIGLPPYAGYLKYLDQFIAELTAARDQVSEKVNQIPPQLAELGQNALNQLDEGIQSTEESAIADVRKAQEGLAGTIASSREKLDVKLTTIPEEVSTSIAGVKEKFETSTASISDTHKANTEKMKVDLPADLDKISADLSQILASTEEKLVSDLDTQKDEATAKIGELGVEIISASDKLAGDWKENITQVGAGLDDKKGELKSKVENSAQATLTTMSGSIDSTIAAFSQFLQSCNSTQVEDLRELGAGINGDLSALKDAQFSAWDETANAVSDEWGRSSDAVKDVSGKLKDDFSTKIKELVAQQLEQAASQLEQIKTQVADVAGKYVDEFITGADNIKTVIDQTVQQQVEKTQGEIRQALDEILGRYTAEIQSQSESYATELKNQINEKAVDFRANIKQMRETFEDQLASSGQSLSGKLEELKGQLLQGIEVLQADITTQMGESLSSGSEKVAGVISTGKDTLTSTLNTHQESIDALIKKNEENLAQSISGAETSLNDLSATQKGNLDDQIKNAGSTYTDEVIGTLEGIKSTISNLSNSAFQVADDNKSAVSATTQQFTEQISAAIAQCQEGIKTASAQVNADLKQPLSNCKDTFNQSLDAASAELQNEITELVTGTGTSIDEFTNTIQQFVGDLQDVVQKYFGAIDQQLGGGAENTISAISGAAQNVRGALEAVLSEFQTKIQADATDATQTVEQAFSSGISSADEPRKALADTWTGMTETQLEDAEKTWALVGEESIFPTIREMIENAKGSVLVVAPKFDQLPWEAIQAAKGVKFTVVCDFDTAKNAKMPAKMVEAGIDLWSYQEQDMIAAVRDQEEILIAPVAPQEDETVAVVSQATPFVKNLSTMLSEFWRRAARRYKE